MLLAPERTDQLDALRTVLAGGGRDLRCEDGHLRVEPFDGAAADLNRLAMKAGIALEEITRVRSTLEDTFLALTADEMR